MNIKSKLFFFIVFCFLSLNSYSQGWIKIGSYKKKGGNYTHYLRDNYESFENGVVTIWGKVEHEVFFYKIKNKNYYNAYTISITEYDIIKKKYRNLYQIVYDKDDDVIYSVENTNLSWVWITPYTIGELEYEYCKNIVK